MGKLAVEDFPLEHHLDGSLNLVTGCWSAVSIGKVGYAVDVAIEGVVLMDTSMVSAGSLAPGIEDEGVPSIKQSTSFIVTLLARCKKIDAIDPLRLDHC